MKNCIIAACIVMVVAMVGFPNLASAQTYYNEIGIFTDGSADPNSSSMNALAGRPFRIFLIAVNPRILSSDAFDGISVIERDMTGISGWEAGIIFPAGVTIVSMTLGSGLINVGTPPYYIVGYSSPLPVSSAKTCVLATFYIKTDNTTAKFIYLTPVSQPSFDGYMAILDRTEGSSNRVMKNRPTSGSFDLPVFGINSTVVDVENELWSDVKALYR